MFFWFCYIFFKINNSKKNYNWFNVFRALVYSTTFFEELALRTI